MSLRQCDKCSEMVDEAKAFCPACGHALVEEKKREEESAYDSMDGTMQFGKTMYGQMLTDMGLNISQQPAEGVEPPIQVVQPAVPTAVQPVYEVIQPAVKPNFQPIGEPKKLLQGGSNKWLIIGGIAVLLLLIFVVAAILVGSVLWSRNF
ncbi:MAG: hypothetical protein ACKVQJ_09045 [Pyrinomonadaceae bacterium]